MDGQVVLLLGIGDRNLLFVALDVPAVAGLPARITVERRLVENQLIVSLVLGGNATITRNPHVAFEHIVTDEATLGDRKQFDPIVGIDRRRVARTLFLFLQFGREFLAVYRHAVFLSDQFGQVDRESVSIVQQERFAAADHPAAGGLFLFDHIVEQIDPGSQCPQECGFLLGDHFGNQILLRRQFGELFAHLPDESVDQLADKRLVETEVSISVPHGAAQDTPDHVPGLHVRRQLPVGNRESNRPQVVGNHPHRDIGPAILTVNFSGQFGQTPDRRLEYVGIVIALFALQHHAKPFEAHAGIHVAGRQQFQFAAGLTVELHENQVPYLDDQVVPPVHQLASVQRGPLLVRAQIVMDFAARAARPRIAHFPEIIVTVSENDMVFGQELLPILVGLVVTVDIFIGTPLENRRVQTLFRQAVHVGKQLPRPRDRLFLKIIPERPVAEHFEHRVMVSVVADLLQVVVLARHAQTFLRIGHPAVFDRRVPQEQIFKLVHPGVGEHQGRVVLDDHRSRRHDHMPFAAEKIEKSFSDLIRIHTLLIISAYCDALSCRKLQN